MEAKYYLLWESLYVCFIDTLMFTILKGQKPRITYKSESLEEATIVENFGEEISKEKFEETFKNGDADIQFLAVKYNLLINQ